MHDIIYLRCCQINDIREQFVAVGGLSISSPGLTKHYKIMVLSFMIPDSRVNSMPIRSSDWKHFFSSLQVQITGAQTP